MSTLQLPIGDEMVNFNDDTTARFDALTETEQSAFCSWLFIYANAKRWTIQEAIHTMEQGTLTASVIENVKLRQASFELYKHRYKGGRLS